MGWLGKIWTAVFPPHCVLCDAPGWRELDLCRGCAAELPRLRQGCPRCSAPGQFPVGSACGACERRPPAFDRVIAPYRYRAPVDFLIQQLKFHERLALATLLAALFDLEAPAVASMALIPVPLHPRRLRQRGFNQALELARPLADRRGVPVLAHALERRRATAPQSELPAGRRRRNLQRAFTVPRHSRLPEHVALVDDVMTTGATAHECAATLKAAGVERVDVWVLARA